MIQQCPDIFILDLLLFLLKGKSLLGYPNFFFLMNIKTMIKQY